MFGFTLLSAKRQWHTRNVPLFHWVLGFWEGKGKKWNNLSTYNISKWHPGCLDYILKSPLTSSLQSSLWVKSHPKGMQETRCYRWGAEGLCRDSGARKRVSVLHAPGEKWTSKWLFKSLGFQRNIPWIILPTNIENFTSLIDSPQENLDSRKRRGSQWKKNSTNLTGLWFIYRCCSPGDPRNR